LLLFDVTRYTFKVAPQTDTFLETTALFRGALDKYNLRTTDQQRPRERNFYDNHWQP
jgi:hypothetical protein